MFLAYCLLKFMSTLAGKETYVVHLKPLAASILPVLVMGPLNQRLQDLTDSLIKLGNLRFSSFIDKGTNQIISIQMMPSTSPTVI